MGKGAMMNYLRHVMSMDGVWYKTNISKDSRFNLPDGTWITANVADYISEKQITVGNKKWLCSAVVDNNVIVGLQFLKAR
jgi:TFIIF-interacting CTD phosphatase-like protein